MQILIYFLVAIIATTLGSMTGMGGGVIIKPVLDFLGDYNVGSINILSSITVFSMALVSTVQQLKSKPSFDKKSAAILGIGAVLGGILGNTLLNYIIVILPAENHVTTIQNAVLALLIIIVLAYMKNKDRIPSKNFSGKISSIILGLVLGLISTFLGIGGGPVNVALLVYIMGNDTKTAVTNSLIIILFSQASRLAVVTVSTGFSSYDLSMLPYMVIGAISGGLIGSVINKKMKEQTVDKSFNGLQIFVFLICLYNIFT